MDEDFTSESPSLVTHGDALCIWSLDARSIRPPMHLSPIYDDMTATMHSYVYSDPNIYRLSDHYAFAKPNDRRALDLMNAAAVEVMKELPDLCIAYGVSDEFRYVQLISSPS